MRILFIAFIIWAISSVAYAADLEVGEIYRLNINIYNLQKVDGTGCYYADADSKFRVLDYSKKANENKDVTEDKEVPQDEEVYMVKFLKILSKKFHKDPYVVEKDEVYILPKKYNNMEMSKLCTPSVPNLVSGPLIVPFKYRYKEESISGESTIGYYMGYHLCPRIAIWWLDRVNVVPFIAGGLSIITVEKEDYIENHSSFTYAFGLLLRNWGDLNAGFVAGFDRIGDKSWENEGELWISFMVGWTLD